MCLLERLEAFFMKQSLSLSIPETSNEGCVIIQEYFPVFDFLDFATDELSFHTKSFFFKNAFAQ